MVQDLQIPAARSVGVRNFLKLLIPIFGLLACTVQVSPTTVADTIPDLPNASGDVIYTAPAEGDPFQILDANNNRLSSVEFDSFTVGQAPQRRFQLFNSSSDPIDTISLSLPTSGNFIEARHDCTPNLLPQTKCQVTLTTAPISDGAFSVPLMLVVTIKNTELRRGLKINGTAAMVCNGIAFGTNGLVSAMNSDSQFFHSAIQENTGKIVTASVQQLNSQSQQQLVLSRYLCSGSIDGAFGSNGKTVVPLPIKVAQATGFINLEERPRLVLTPEGKWTVFVQTRIASPAADTPASDITAVRFQAGGGLDNSFGIEGVIHFNLPTSIGFLTYLLAKESFHVRSLPDGKYLVAGGFVVRQTVGNYFGGFILRLKADGALDTTFGTAGIVQEVGPVASLESGYPKEILLQPDGRFIAAFTLSLTKYPVRLKRFNQNGTLDMTFGTGGIVLGPPLCQMRSMASRSALALFDGKILLACSQNVLDADLQTSVGWTPLVSRFNANGALDITFGNAGVFTVPPSKSSAVDAKFFGELTQGLMVFPNGKIVLVGRETYFSPILSNLRLHRLKANGTLENENPTLSIAGQFGDTDHVDEILPLPDGRFTLSFGNAATPAGLGARLMRFNLKVI